MAQIVSFREVTAWTEPPALVACVYFGITIPVQTTAGQNTNIAVAYSIISDLKLHVAISYAVSPARSPARRTLRVDPVSVLKME